jgi:hypothetical protein
MSMTTAARLGVAMLLLLVPVWAHAVTFCPGPARVRRQHRDWHPADRGLAAMTRAAVVLILLLGGPTVVAAQAPPDIYFNSFEFPDMRVIRNGGGHTVMLPGEMSPMPSNGGVGKGVSGSGVLTDMNYAQSRLQPVNDPAHCRNGSQWCMRASYSASTQGSDDTFYSGYYGTPPTDPDTFIAQGCRVGGPPAVCNTFHYFFRMFIKWDTNFQLAVIPPDTACLGKLIYMRNNRFPANIGGTVILKYSAGAGGQNLFLQIENDNPTAPGGSQNVGGFSVFIGDGSWHEVEVELDEPNNHVRVWWDNVVRIDADATLMQNLNIDTNEWGMYMNNLGNGACRVVNTASFWVDDVSTSSQRIGGGGQTPPSPPLTPSNLRLGLLTLGLAGLAVVVTLRRTP